MAKNKYNAPCICKHSYANHGHEQFYMRDKNTVDTRITCGVRSCDCTEFKMDNLRFLEKEDESRKQ